MSIVLHPWQLLVVAMAGIINREQAKVLEYLHVENEVLKEHLKGKGRLRFTDDQRRRLAAKAKALGGRALRALPRTRF